MLDSKDILPLKSNTFMIGDDSFELSPFNLGFEIRVNSLLESEKNKNDGYKLLIEKIATNDVGVFIQDLLIVVYEFSNLNTKYRDFEKFLNGFLKLGKNEYNPDLNNIIEVFIKNFNDANPDDLNLNIDKKKIPILMKMRIYRFLIFLLGLTVLLILI